MIVITHNKGFTMDENIEQMKPAKQEILLKDGTTVQVMNFAQRSPEWRLSRLGKFTASMFDVFLKRAKTNGGGLTDTARSYIREVLAERLTGQAKELSAPALQWGTDNEPKAKAMYQHKMQETVEEVGFLSLNSYIGSSPDGFVRKDGIIEIKCPYNSANHINTLLTNEVPDEYMAQIQGNLWLSGRQYCDYISFDPRMVEPRHRMIVVTIGRDEAFIKDLKERLALAVNELNLCLAALEDEEEGPITDDIITEMEDGQIIMTNEPKLVPVEQDGFYSDPVEKKT